MISGKISAVRKTRVLRNQRKDVRSQERRSNQDASPMLQSKLRLAVANQKRGAVATGSLSWEIVSVKPYAVANLALRQTSAPAAATFTSFSTVLPLAPMAPIIVPD